MICSHCHQGRNEWYEIDGGKKKLCEALKRERDLLREALGFAWHDWEPSNGEPPCKCAPLFSSEEYCNAGCLIRAALAGE